MDDTNTPSMKQIVLIGDTQSGKTTLATGLAKSSSPDFTVGYADDTTRAYLTPLIAEIEAGRWPLASSGGNMDLTLSLKTRGHEVTASFKEYMGERMADATYVEKLVGEPEGALILLNPGMKSIHDDSQRADLIGHLKAIIDHLKAHRCAAVARVVTASDRLKTDLQAVAPLFRDCLNEIDNYLNVSGLRWKPFDVTITGELADQSAPSFAKGASNTAPAPFRWVIGQIERQALCRKLSRLFRWTARGCAVLALAAALVYGAVFWSEWRELGQLADVEKQCADRFETARKPGGSVANMNAAVTDYLTNIHSAEVAVVRFGSLKTRRGELVTDWNRKYDNMHVGYLRRMIDDLNAKRPEDFGHQEPWLSVDRLVDGFRVRDAADAALRTQLTNDWAAVKPKIQEKYDVKIGTELAGELTRVDHDLQAFAKDIAQLRAEIADVGEQIGKWMPSTEKGKTRKDDLQGRLQKLLPQWERKIADQICRTDADRIVEALKTNDQSESVRVRTDLRQVFDFAPAHDKASPEVLQESCEKLARAQDAFWKKFIDDCASGWKPDQPNRKWNKWPHRPVLPENDRAFLLDAFDLPDIQAPAQKLSVRVSHALDERLKAAVAKWEQYQQSVCETFISQEITAGRPAVDVFDAYKSWYEENADNPFVAEVDNRMAQVLTAYFDAAVGKFRQACSEADVSALRSSDEGRRQVSREFSDFQKICLALGKDGRGLTNSWCAAFARDCVQVGQIAKGMNGAFAQSLEITQVDVKVEEDGQYNDYIGLKFGLSSALFKGQDAELALAKDEIVPFPEDYLESPKGGGTWQTIWEGRHSVFLNPWTEVRLCPDVTLDIANTVYDAKPIGDISTRLFPRRSPYQSGSLSWTWKCLYDDDQTYTCTVRISCTFSGVDFFELYEKDRKGR